MHFIKLRKQSRNLNQNSEPEKLISVMKKINKWQIQNQVNKEDILPIAGL